MGMVESTYCALDGSGATGSRVSFQTYEIRYGSEATSGNMGQPGRAESRDIDRLARTREGR